MHSVRKRIVVLLGLASILMLTGCQSKDEQSAAALPHHQNHAKVQPSHNKMKKTMLAKPEVSTPTIEDFHRNHVEQHNRSWSPRTPQ